MAASRTHPALVERIVPFTAGDGMHCNLMNVRGEAAPTRGPVLLVHGAGVRANVFRPPAATTIVDYLVERGYDVWLENWRASIDLPRSEWNLDKAAVHDHPAAVRAVVRETGADHIKALVHCQGSCSFVMSVVAGLVPQVETVVTNAVSLHPIVPTGSRAKLAMLLPFVGLMTDYLNPQWGERAPTIPARLIAATGALAARGCDSTVCTQVSFTYGSGCGALWRHENLTDDTHAWLAAEFGHVPLSFFEQMARCVRRGRLVSVDGLRELPADFTAAAPLSDARFAFFAGELNQCFRPESQIASYDHFDRHHRDYHSLHVLPGYSHLDVFWGKRAAEEVFPLLAAELERPTMASPSRAMARA